MVPKFNIGDIVELKKQHPCGNKQWEITRLGIDIKIRCLGCDHQVMLPRIKFEKSIKKVIQSKQNDGNTSNKSTEKSMEKSMEE